MSDLVLPDHVKQEQQKKRMLENPEAQLHQQASMVAHEMAMSRAARISMLAEAIIKDFEKDGKKIKPSDLILQERQISAGGQFILEWSFKVKEESLTEGRDETYTQNLDFGPPEGD